MDLIELIELIVINQEKMRGYDLSPSHVYLGHSEMVFFETFVSRHEIEPSLIFGMEVVPIDKANHLSIGCNLLPAESDLADL